MSQARIPKLNHKRAAISALGPALPLHQIPSSSVADQPLLWAGRRESVRRGKYESFRPQHLAFLRVSSYTQKGGIFCFIQEKENGNQMHLKIFIGSAADCLDLKKSTELKKKNIVAIGVLILDSSGEL